MLFSSFSAGFQWVWGFSNVFWFVFACVFLSLLFVFFCGFWCFVVFSGIFQWDFCVLFFHWFLMGFHRVSWVSLVCVVCFCWGGGGVLVLGSKPKNQINPLLKKASKATNNMINSIQVIENNVIRNNNTIKLLFRRPFFENKTTQHSKKWSPRGFRNTSRSAARLPGACRHQSEVASAEAFPRPCFLGISLVF